jgi:hypothetical protein
MNNIIETATFDLLLEKNNEYIALYKQSKLIEFIKSKSMEDAQCREKLLSSIQVLSDYFQKHIFLRFVFTDNKFFIQCALDHLKEEFLHHEVLMKERHYKESIFDPILESTCSWFAWRMFNTNDEEKAVLIHLILETSANVFFNMIAPIMSQFGDYHYFKKHADADDKHEKMSHHLLIGLSTAQYKRLIEIQSQGWAIMLTALDRIAELAL